MACSLNRLPSHHPTEPTRSNRRYIVPKLMYLKVPYDTRDTARSHHPTLPNHTPSHAYLPRKYSAVWGLRGPIRRAKLHGGSCLTRDGTIASMRKLRPQNSPFDQPKHCNIFYMLYHRSRPCLMQGALKVLPHHVIDMQALILSGIFISILVKKILPLILLVLSPSLNADQISV